MKEKECQYGCPEGTSEHRLNTMVLEIGEPGDLYDKLESIPYTKHNTIYKNLSHDQLWNNLDKGEAWDNPVEALKEVITRELDTENPEVHYVASLYIYRWIAGDERFFKSFTEGQYWTAKYTYNAAEADLDYSTE